MEKLNLSIKGYIQDVGKIKTFERVGKPPLSKQLLALLTNDEQLLFCELRPNNFEKAKFLKAGMSVHIDFIFAGSMKNGKKYNNIIITDISPL